MERQIKPFFGDVISYFTRHATAANLVLGLMIILGLVASTRLRSQFFPDVVINTIVVSVNWSGAGPEDVDKGIISVMEPSLLGVEGLEKIVSTSRQGLARIVLDFEDSWDMDRAGDEVKSIVDTIANLPDTASDPIVRRIAWRDKVTDVIISGPVAIDQLRTYADEFSQKIYRKGISRTTTGGIEPPVINVLIPEEKLIQYDLSLQKIALMIKEEAGSDPAGDLSDGVSRLKTGVDKKSVRTLSSIPIISKKDGTKIYLQDIAILRINNASRTIALLRDGNPAVSIRVDRTDLGDAIKIQNDVESSVEELRQTLPQNVKIELSGTRSEAISNRLTLLLKNGATGLIFVLVLLFLFLSLKTAFWVAVGIPAAMLAALSFMYVSGITLNMISLFALILCLGIVVDDAIVVGEHADFRSRKLREGPYEAAENGAIRMSMPVFTATITTILAFSGMILIGGRFGSLISDLPFTVVVVLAASLIECFLVLPNHMAHSLKQSHSSVPWYDYPSYYFNQAFNSFREGYFRPSIRILIMARYPLLAGALLLLTISISLLLTGEVKWRFFNAPERGGFTGNIAMLPGATRDDTFSMLKELEDANNRVARQYEKEHGEFPVTFSLLKIGGNSGRGLSGAEFKDKDLLGSISVELIDADSRPYSSFSYIASLQDEVNKSPLLETLSFRGWRSGPGGDSVSIQLLGNDINILKDAALYLISELEQFPEISGLEDTQSFDKSELILQITPKGSSLGFSTDQVAKELYSRLNGIEAATYSDENREAKIMVMVPEGDLGSDFLYKTWLRSSSGAYVSLSDIVEIKSQRGFSTINRENGLNSISVTGDLSEDDPQMAELISKKITDNILPNLSSRFSVQAIMTGLAEQERNFLNDSLISFSLCLFGIFLALTWVFSSWTRPLVVMSIIPFGLIGTIWGHYFWQIPMSLFSVIGLIGMTGIIINDSIVLVSTINEYEEKNHSEPVIDAICDRLRPVLLTTLTTVFGLAPLLFETSQDAQFLKPTVVTLVFGLGFGMLIILFLVPSLISVQRDIKFCFYALGQSLMGEVPRALKRGMWLLLIILFISFFLLIGQYVLLSYLGPILPHFLSFLPYSGSLILLYFIILICSTSSFFVYFTYFQSFSAEDLLGTTKKNK